MSKQNPSKSVPCPCCLRHSRHGGRRSQIPIAPSCWDSPQRRDTTQTEPGSGQHFEGCLTHAGVPLASLAFRRKLKGFLEGIMFLYLAGATSERPEQCQSCL